MTDQLDAMLHTMSALDSVKPINAETVLGNRPVSLFLDPALCPVCCDATVEKGEVCGECASLPVIDLTVRRDIDCYEQEYAPASQRYGAVDRNTYDGEGRGNVIGMGATKASAIRDLLTKLAEMSHIEKLPAPDATRVEIATWLLKKCARLDKSPTGFTSVLVHYTVAEQIAALLLAPLAGSAEHRAQDDLSQPQYRSIDCGNEEPAEQRTLPEQTDADGLPL